MLAYMVKDKMGWLAVKSGSKAAAGLGEIMANRGIPHLTVVTPDGKVELDGHPAGILPQLEKLLDKTK
jgi:hypothetical protein